MESATFCKVGASPRGILPVGCVLWQAFHPGLDTKGTGLNVLPCISRNPQVPSGAREKGWSLFGENM